MCARGGGGVPGIVQRGERLATLASCQFGDHAYRSVVVVLRALIFGDWLREMDGGRTVGWDIVTAYELGSRMHKIAGRVVRCSKGLGRG